MSANAAAVPTAAVAWPSLSRWMLRATAGVLMAAAFVPASALDVFEVDEAIPKSPARAALGEQSDVECSPRPLSEPLRLQDAVERALCTNPKALEAWANIKLQAAVLGVSRSSYLPSLVATSQSMLAQDATNVDDHPELSSANRRRAGTQSLALDWVLYDFGRRDAALRNSEHLLAAAQANHAAVLLDVFAEVAHSYYAAQAAAAALAAARDVEATAKSSFDAAAGRAGRGVAPISDELQAQTALVEATLQRAKSQSDLQIALGSLAINIGMAPDSSLSLPGIEADLKDSEIAQTPVSELIQRAASKHPRILQANSLRDAAKAKVEAARAEYLPSVSMKGSASHDNTPVTSSLGAPQYGARANNRSVSIVLNVPLFDGFGRDYGVSRSLRQVEIEEAHVKTARQQVAADIWSGYHSLKAAAQTFEQGNALLEVALRSYSAASARYSTGVGPIVELLDAQTALASARRRKLQAATDWRAASLMLSAKLGAMPTNGQLF